MRLRMNLCIKIYFLLLIILSGLTDPGRVSAQDIKIKELQLEFPKPAIPFYHFKMRLDLPHPSIIEVKVIINRDTLLTTDHN